MRKYDNEVKKGWVRYLYVVSPLLILIACLGLLNLVPRQLSGGGEDQLAWQQTASPSPEANLVEKVRQIPTLTPTTVEPEPQATSVPATAVPLPPDAQIQLLGPPENSNFSAIGSVALYWQWPIPLQESQNMGVYLKRGGAEFLLGVLDEPNIGDYYRWELDSKEILGNGTDNTAVSVQWLIRLESKTDASIPILESEGRNISLIP